MLSSVGVGSLCLCDWNEHTDVFDHSETGQSQYEYLHFSSLASSLWACVHTVVYCICVHYACVHLCTCVLCFY